MAMIRRLLTDEQPSILPNVLANFPSTPFSSQSSVGNFQFRAADIACSDPCKSPKIEAKFKRFFS
jgi:hypothetical protein